MRAASAPPRLAREGRRRARLPLTPLIDVVFILLVFFMLASSFADWRSLRLAVAEPAGGAPSAEGAVLVDLRTDGLRLGGAPVAAEAFEARLAARLAAEPDLRVLVRPARGVSVQDTVTLMDRLEALGVSRAALLAAP